MPGRATSRRRNPARPHGPPRRSLDFPGTVDLDALAAALRRAGVPAADAEEYSALIGDTPEHTADGRQIIVRDDSGRELARVPAWVFQ